MLPGQWLNISRREFIELGAGGVAVAATGLTIGCSISGGTTPPSGTVSDRQVNRMHYADADGLHIAYDDWGPRSDDALLCLPGWCVNRGFFDSLKSALSARRRVIALDWRGHGDSDRPPGDFGHRDLVSDAIAVIEASGVHRVVPIAQAHGGWVAFELRRRLGERIAKIVATSWLVLDPPPPFLGVLQALQDQEHWQQAREQLFSMWITGAPESVAERVRKEMGAYGFEMWARAAREIAAEYGRHGSPLRALSGLTTPPGFLHIFSQPRAPEFLASQEAFAREHMWFSVLRLEALSHFPPLEMPEATAVAIERFIAA